MNDLLISRLAACVYDLVESGALDELNDGDGCGYDEACALMGLDDFETEAVLKFIDDDLRIV